jgi:molybdate transport system substrate-binding protein
MRCAVSLGLVTLLVTAAGSGRLAAQDAAERELVVFAAASLSGAFQELGAVFERFHPETRVRFNFAGSQQLAVQLEQGARADLFAAADERWMTYAEERRLLAGPARRFARNRLVVIVPAGNPARITRLQDLARPGVKVVIGAEAVPVGAYAREMLAKLAGSSGFPRDFERRVLGNVVSHEENVKAVVSKVQLGEADAGVVYASDAVGPVARHLRTVAVPESRNAMAEYPLAVLRGAASPRAAETFADLVLGIEGQRVLQRFGLLPGTVSSSLATPAAAR